MQRKMAYTKKPEGVFRDPRIGKIYEQRNGARHCHWSAQMVGELKRMYATTKNEELAEFLGVSPRAVVRKARELGLAKDPKWQRDISAFNVRFAIAKNRIEGNAGRFPKGHQSDTQFKPGHKQSPEVRAKLAAAQKRSWHSLARRQRQSEMMKEWWANRWKERRV